MYESGQQLANRYRLIRRLGGGEERPVWAARDIAADREVALKLHSGADDRHARADERLLALQHPHIAPWPERHASGSLVIDSAPLQLAGDLSTLRGRPFGEWLPRLGEVAAAVQTLHAAGYVHGDLKSQNVLLGAGGALLADFELALPIGAPRAAGLPRSRYSSSPEQRAGEAAVIADDVYSYGALLHEMLTGSPPGYGGGAEEAPIPTPVPAQPAPRELLELCARCLAADPAQRPPDMASIASELERLSALPSSAARAAPLLTPPSTGVEVLRPTWRRTETGAIAVDPVSLQRQGFQRGLLVAAGALALLAAAAAFLLPSRYQSPAKVVMPAPAVVATPPPVETATDRDLKSLAVVKSDVDERRGRLAQRWQVLLDGAVREWDAARARQVDATLTAIDAHIQSLDYRAAQAALPSVETAMRELEGERAQALAAALRRGQEAIDAGRSADASAAFAVALNMDPRNAVATRGARRAATLDAVLETLTRARAQEQAGNSAAALVLYRQSLQQDSLAPGAADAVTRINTRAAGDRFGALMSQGYAELAAGRTAQARRAFEAARVLRPASTDLPPAFAQLGAAEQSGSLQQLLTAARAAATSEHWDDAVKSYQQALAIDATLADAQSALAHATERARLGHDLQRLIDEPERVYVPEVRRAAADLLTRARAASPGGSLLNRQIAALNQTLLAADTPVQVALVSDGQTQVTIYRVGEQGAFTERSLSLRPGRYTVVGTRTGFRDVRRELRVQPGQAGASLRVACEDPI